MRLRPADLPAAVRAVPVTPAAVRERLRLDENEFVGGAAYVEARLVSVVDVFDEAGVRRNGRRRGNGRKQQQQPRAGRLPHFDECLSEPCFREDYGSHGDRCRFIHLTKHNQA